MGGRKVLVESSSDGVTVNRNAKVIAADNAATNGVVHIIDTVLLPPNIVDLAQGNEDLSTLVTALTAGKLVSALQGTGPFTVFAPSNAAFAKLPQQELTRLLDANNVGDLVSILKYHVVSGAAVYSKELKASQNVKTLEGKDVLIETLSPEQLVADIQQAISSGVELWNAGNYEKTAEVYREVVTKYAPFTNRLQQGLQQALGKP